MLPAHRFAHYPRLTSRRATALAAAFSDWEAAWTADKESLIAAGWKPAAAEHLIAWRESFDETKAEKILDQEDIRILTKDDEEYPHHLKACDDAPFALFIRGSLENLRHTVAVVGSRTVTPYGEQITTDVTAALARSGVTIVSGLALGVDGLAHRAALDAGGRTIAVLGGGVNKTHVQPSSHTSLADDIIAKGGAVISEYPPGTVPNTYTFPARNRIVAGMSAGTLVTEARTGSGALITADKAHEYARPVFAMPHPVTNPNGAGTNTLLQSYGTLVTDAQPILSALNINTSVPVTNAELPTDLSEEETLVMQALSREPTHIDELTKSLPLSGPAVGSTLTMLELAGHVRDIGGKMYIISN